MPELQNAVPLRWLSGPLESAKQSRTGTLAADTKQIFDRWHSPAALEILRGSPIDCLVVSWAAGLDEDATQQKSIAPLVEAARKRGLAVVGWTEGKIDANAAIASAEAAGLAAIAIPNFKGKSDFPVIASGDRGRAPWDSQGPAVAVTGNVWPGVGATPARDDPNAGPTGLPWLDSNSWFVQVARARLETPLWLLYDPPGKGQIVTAQRYAAAVADAEVAGARWVISLDEAVRAGVLSGNANAKDCLGQIGKTVAFFQTHREWKSYRPLGNVGVISDFTGENFDKSGEILNLAARRDLLFRVVWKQKALAQPFTGLKTLLYADAAQPAPELRRKMMSFAEQGGLVVAGAKWGNEGASIDPGFNSMFDVRRFGKGRLAIGKDDLADAYQVTVETQLLHSYRNDLVKFYNGSSSGCTRMTGSPDGRKALLQSLSYADRRGGGGGPGPERTVWFQEKYASARACSIGADGLALKSEPANEFPGVEFHLPVSFAGQAYLAMQLEAHTAEE